MSWRARGARRFWVYVLANPGRTLYVGVTNDLATRLAEHRAGVGSALTARYRIDRLVYYEEADDPLAAIAREKRIKGWSRAKKLALVGSLNPGWLDLGAEMLGLGEPDTDGISDGGRGTDSSLRSE